MTASLSHVDAKTLSSANTPPASISALSTMPSDARTSSVESSRPATNLPPAATAYTETLWSRSKNAIRSAALFVLPRLLGLALLILLWSIVAEKNPSLPSPSVTWQEAIKVFSDPFYQNGPNDQGIGWNIYASLKRVALGFGLAALAGIPLGFLIGRYQFLAGMFNPIISLLKPVSPLAWLPIGLLVFKAAHPAAIWSIFICSIWPMMINTAIGVQRIPQDYLNVAKVLDLSAWRVLTRIYIPSVLPYMLTGVRLAIGTAWLVIVAAEMLTGGVGIGFWVWDEWNNLNVPHILIAIVVIGLVGLILEQILIAAARAFTYEE